ncbi:MAG: hypothetical protein OXI55_16845 [Gammaproteobacteria bacterium]|nr:hypothetical protein [Gammaproteobacteria bacterium]
MSEDATSSAIESLGGPRFDSAFGRRGMFYVGSCTLAFAAVAMSGATLLHLRTPLELTALALLAALAAVGAAVCFRMRYGRYIVAGDTLVLRRQWQTRRIPLGSIVDVRRAKDASVFVDFEDDFALGTAALEIRYGDEGTAGLPRQLAVSRPGGRAFVSPRDEAAFLAAIGHSVTY